MATGMKIERSRRAQQFVTIGNAEARDTRLSFRARGLHHYLLSLPSGWHTTTERIAAENREGRDAIRTALNELATYRYVTRVKFQDERGRWSTVMTVHDVPVPEGAEDDPERASEEAPPKTDSQASVRPAETRVVPGRTEDGFPVVGFPVVGNPVVGKPGAMKKTGNEDVFKKTGQEDVLSLSGLGRRIAARLGAAGATDVGEREISSIEGEIKSRAKGPVTAYLRAIPDDDLRALLDEYRANVADHQRRQQEAAEAAAAAAEQAAATASLPACTHGVPAGSAPLRPGLPPRCPLCRKGLADDGEAFTPASRDAIDEAKRKLAGLAGTVRTADGGSRPA